MPRQASLAARAVRRTPACWKVCRCSLACQIRSFRPSATVAAGEEIIRRWDADRSFFIALSGRYDVFIDDRMIRTLGPGEHFGELAARDWGGGYGYARTATVRCAQDGQLLRLSSDDFQWLVQTQPAVRAELANILADRLRQR
jgi:CRP-like cAMP-binding protein